jgi:hypothetical protein
VLDNFNRVNGSIGANWSGSTTHYSIASNLLKETGSGDIYWVTSFGTSQEAYVTLTGINIKANEIDLVLKSQSRTSYKSGLIEILYDPTVKVVQVWTYTSTQGWVQYGADIPVTFVNGDKFGAKAAADGTVSVYRNGTLLGTRSVTAWPYYNRGGYIGLWLVNGSGTTMDNFGGGNN